MTQFKTLCEATLLKVNNHAAAQAKAEFDMVLFNGNSVALLEVKHQAHLSAPDPLEKQTQRYREVFPEHASYKLYGGLAGLSVPDDTVQAAHKRGMFVLKRQGNLITVDAEAMRAFNLAVLRELLICAAVSICEAPNKEGRVQAACGDSSPDPVWLGA